eukprot:CAMPEP_0169234152 /NCGR_PEP_ID=MMETSP1016-20121227/28013_1 /TAXON_ID=342587 /ORGANISM="Karlodinium micrum, Strain CCMP2283" /LENGTH=119 /DNA_ID=CAMNT_0009313575 /DNA_START=54 /DNA_END=413 /DNA_ORIENTATION=-
MATSFCLFLMLVVFGAFYHSSQLGNLRFGHLRGSSTIRTKVVEPELHVPLERLGNEGDVQVGSLFQAEVACLVAIGEFVCLFLGVLLLALTRYPTPDKKLPFPPQASSSTRKYICADLR